ncbi:energy-coupling factor transporter transmembrane component T family protein [Pelagibacterium limicola]|uniref:energy-coupling factor transporter transmembrane component T family protein n=1 Tax=Pelagibacterium limicola TaxID=2791022 RepID=UPI0018AFDDC4|nr:energy-coupling factor transporter transmembrane component T [Pelagibacterium limicola]
MHPEAFADTRLRLVGLFVLAFCFSSLHTPAALAAMLGITAIAVLYFGPKIPELFRRLRLPGLVVLGLVLMLPFASGQTVLGTIGPLGLRAEGLAAAATIALRFVSIFTLMAALIGNIPVPRLFEALRALGLPAMLTDMAVLTLRHIEDIRTNLSRMRTAMQLRGAAAGFWNGQFRATGWALASLILRSHARSERVYHAMILRGHGAPGAAPSAAFVPKPADWALLFALLAAGTALLVIDRLA